ncbi:hypothetical protein ASPBRDRAFT_392847 [Aspergillus brasiliensis CBS 101740]|uniref:Uncharacterized protein n=1 Tax=Aspergillus brasiliensis (strain CBS 101740 / IMI 381727 / IBT 21946) TaxID=767769 RepID=A0A1L9UWL4_ASPBC|nr:hypothetical protein ASPBRDRAFT_392847 [Aspergillus brasiliensis CBS 101740]
MFGASNSQQANMSQLATLVVSCLYLSRGKPSSLLGHSLLLIDNGHLNLQPILTEVGPKLLGALRSRCSLCRGTRVSDLEAGLLCDWYICRSGNQTITAYSEIM